MAVMKIIVMILISATLFSHASAFADVLVCEPHVEAEAGYMEGVDFSDPDAVDVQAGPTGKALVLDLDKLRKGKPVRKIMTAKSLPGQIDVTLVLTDNELTINLVHEENGRRLGRYRMDGALVSGIHTGFEVEAPDAGLRRLDFGCGIPGGR